MRRCPAPSGSLSIIIDEKTLTAVVDGISIDLLGGNPSELEYGVTLLYETFNTVSPFSIYPGGFEIPIPLGSAQIISSQMESGLPGGLLLEPLKAGGYAVTGVLNADATSVFELGTGPQEFTVPVVLPVIGSLHEGEGGWEIELSISLSVDEEVPLEDVPPFEGVPLPLPTLPPSDLDSEPFDERGVERILNSERAVASFGCSRGRTLQPRRLKR